MIAISIACIAILLHVHSHIVFATDDISSDLETLIDSTGVPSLAAAAVVDGKLVAAGASGIRKRGTDEKVTIQDKYHIGSCTKSMTAVLAAIMVQEGKISWESTIGEILQSKKVHPDFQKVTLKQLLSNSGGCPGDIDPELWSELWESKGSYTKQRKNFAEGILSRPPAYTPGSETLYSNAGFSIAGYLLEKTMRVSYEELLQEKLFVPLGMKSAGFRAPATPGKVDQPYGHNPEPVDPEPAGDNPPAIAPAGAVHCSIIDFAKYAAFHLGASPAALLDEDTLAYLHSPEDEGREYWMGWIITTRDWAGGKALNHAGSNTMFYSVIWVAPERDFAAVALSNTGEDEGFALCDQAIAQLIEKYLAN